MAYRITKAQCLATISGVCSQCGGKLEPIETVDNSNDPTFWTGCLKCSRFDNGVSQKTYWIAKELVEKYHYRPYSHIHDGYLEDKETRKYKHEQQISGACEVVNNVLHIATKVKEEKNGKQKRIEYHHDIRGCGSSCVTDHTETTPGEYHLHAPGWDFGITLTKVEAIEIINQLTITMGISFQIATVGPGEEMIAAPSDRLREICGNCGFTNGSHRDNYCLAKEGGMDWENGPGNIFEPTGEYKEDV